jgi:hypothetical protein
MDLADLIKPKWVFRSDSAPDWDAYPYSVNAMTAVDEFTQSEEEDSTQGVKALIRAICKRHTDSEVHGSSSELTDEDTESLSQEDIQRFSREFIEHNKNLVEREDGPLVKSEDQSDAAFLVDVLAAENKKQSERFKDTFSSLRSRLGGILGTNNAGLRSVTQSLLKQNENLENAYGSRHPSFSPSPHDFKPPPKAYPLCSGST